MNDRFLKLSELKEVDSEVFDKKIDTVRVYIYAGLFGFAGYHWFFLKKPGLGLARALLSTATAVIAILAGLKIIESNYILMIITFLIIISLIWTSIDLFLINKMSNENDKRNEELAIKRVLEKAHGKIEGE